MTVQPISITSNLTPREASLRVHILENELQQLQPVQNNSPATKIRIEQIQLELVQLQHYLAKHSTLNDLAVREIRSRPVDPHQVENTRREHLTREFSNLERAHHRGEVDMNARARMFQTQRELSTAQVGTDSRGGGRIASGTSSSYMTLEEARMRTMQIHQELAQLAELEETNPPTIQGRIIELQSEMQRLSRLYPEFDLMFDSQAPVEDRPIDTQPPIDRQQPVENVENETPVIPDWVFEVLSDVLDLHRRYPTLLDDQPPDMNTSRQNTSGSIEIIRARKREIADELVELDTDIDAIQQRIRILKADLEDLTGYSDSVLVPIDAQQPMEVVTEQQRSIEVDTQEPSVENLRQPNPAEEEYLEDTTDPNSVRILQDLSRNQEMGRPEASRVTDTLERTNRPDTPESITEIPEEPTPTSDLEYNGPGHFSEVLDFCRAHGIPLSLSELTNTSSEVIQRPAQNNPVTRKKRMDPRKRLRAVRMEQVKKQMRRRIKKIKTRPKPKRKVPPSVYCPKPLRQLLRRDSYYYPSNHYYYL